MPYWLGDFAPQRLLFDIGFLQIHWYGLIIVAGVTLGFLLSRKLYLKKQKTDKLFVDLMFYTIIVGFIGARLWHVFVFHWDYYSEFPSEILKIWHGGIAIQGGIIFGALTIYYFARKHKENFWYFTDIMVPGLVIGQTIGRWGNFFNQELYGWPTQLPWGIYIEKVNRVAGFEASTHFHPAFLYESLLNMLLFVLLWQRVQKVKLGQGFMTALYLIGYGIIRFVMAFIRIDPLPKFAGLRASQIVSLIFVFGALYILYQRRTYAESDGLAKE